MHILNYKELLDETRKWYKSIKKVFCPALNDFVVFNSKGFHHLIYDGKGRLRTYEERIRRLKLVRFAPSVIQDAQRIDWKTTTSATEHLTFKMKITIEAKPAVLRVIVRKTTKGNYYYYSVMDE